MSWLHNEHRACTFFGDRVRAEAFEVTERPLPLWKEPGLEWGASVGEQKEGDGE